LKIDKNKIEFFLFRSILFLLKKLGLEKTRKLASKVGLFIYYFIPIRRATTISNLHKAFPQKSKSEIRSIARKNYQSITITFFELMLIPHLPHSIIENQVECTNVELINEKVQNGKGLILLTAHFGNWEFIISYLAPKLEGIFNILVKPQRNPFITKWLEKTRHVARTKIIPIGVSVKSIYQALNNKEVVLIAGDQRGHKDGPRFNFFNQPTSYYTGTAAIVDRMNCNLLICFIQRKIDLTYKLTIKELDFSETIVDEDERVSLITQKYIELLEELVKENPEQYFWMHKLWKY
jgi:KDO2-lipid IV(A) lauroyltransferase